jgi:hypothetical protein
VVGLGVLRVIAQIGTLEAVAARTTDHPRQRALRAQLNTVRA